MPELPAIQEDPDKPQRVRTGFAVEIGQSVAIEFEGENRTVNLVNKVPAGCAVRAVAVLNTGENRVLKAGGSRPHGIEVFWVPARHGEFTENYSRVIASQIKELLIQTRPYQWAEFHGIALKPR